MKEESILRHRRKRFETKKEYVMGRGGNKRNVLFFAVMILFTTEDTEDAEIIIISEL